MQNIKNMIAFSTLAIIFGCNADGIWDVIFFFIGIGGMIYYIEKD
jgi:hypothetical protein